MIFIMSELREKKEDRKYLFILAGFACVCVLYYYEGRMNVQNTTAYLFSYEYGFIARGFIGTILDYILKMIHWHLTYRGAMIVSGVATIVYFVSLFFLYATCLKKTTDITTKKMLRIMIILVSIIAFPMFLTWNNFGRLDEYLWILTIWALTLLVTEKVEWLIVPICMVACLIHEGFVFTNSGIILAVLLWKVLTKSKQEQKKYLAIFIITFASLTVIFLYITFGRHPIAQSGYDVIVSEAQRLADEGGNTKNFNDAYSLLKSELLLQSVYQDESAWHRVNAIETPIATILLLPIIVLGIKILVTLTCKKETLRVNLANWTVALGVITVIPELVLKVDFGRWFFCIFMYYLLIFLVMMTMHNEQVICAVKTIYQKHETNDLWWCGLFLYVLIFMPFRDVYISDVSTKILEVVTRII